MSSMCPAVVVGAGGDVQLVVGAAGGTKITTSVAQVTLLHRSLGLGIQDAVDVRRIHHQLTPMQIWAEHGFSEVWDDMPCHALITCHDMH